ncbi:vWA domain-containing protein [Bernardetia sp.]|uniref:vWA domain-containing protein n=1 Tax=Bernardetia sp. TaxID=1937974 RepID=UPI0025B9A07C|nr:von Willebrand factor type A domain-containing protein [Bernardetia sp.]
MKIYKYTFIAFLFLGALFISNFAFSQRTITGTVTSADGALPGATVQVKGTTQGTQTDFDGKYTITVPEGYDVLVFRFIGFQDVEETIGARSVIDVTLVEEARLSEVVVTTYGKSKRRNRGGRKKKNKSVKIRGASSYNYSYQEPNTESYAAKEENSFHSVAQNPLSTFSIDVDKASYSNVRRFLNNGEMPPQDAVRVEEMINYFNYDYKEPTGEHPFGVTTEYGNCAWNKDHKLVLVGLQAKKIKKDKLPNSNLVFLVDVSGSMSSELPLLKKGLTELVKELRDKDKVSIVVYAGAAGVVLPSTSNKKDIIASLDKLEAGGSTAGGEGIKLAYKIARENFIKNGTNRVILCTDGDFNVGASSDGDMKRLIENERKSGVFLTCLGFGMGNYKDSKLEMLADKGNGNYGYINDFQEARKMLVTEFAGTLFTLAKDVKIQIEFNPNYVAAYRLVGYENRLLNEEDFDDDTKDAGEIGAGHTVTALYEIIPVGVKSDFLPKEDKDGKKLKYQTSEVSEAAGSQELMTVKFRYKQPDGNKSTKFEEVVMNKIATQNSENFIWTNAVAMFGMILTDSKYKKEKDKDLYEWILENAPTAKTKDEEGYRGEFIRLVKTAQSLKK